MFNLTKLFTSLTVLTLILGAGAVLAQGDISGTPEVNLDENISAQDLEIEEPNLLPDSPFYFLKNLGRNIQSFFTFDPIKKAELKSKFANERLIEVKKLVELKKKPEIIKKGLENYQNEIDEIKTQSEKIKEKAQENLEVESFLDKLTKHQLLHEIVLEKLEGQVPEEVFSKIKEVRNNHLLRFGEIMTKLDNKPEQIQERLEKNLEEIKGSKFKNFKNLEILKELEEKVPEQIKESIQKVQANVLNRLRGDLEKMSPEDQEKFENYTEKISGKKETHLEILEDLKEKEIEPIEKIKPKSNKHIEKTEPKIGLPIEEKIEK